MSDADAATPTPDVSDHLAPRRPGTRPGLKRVVFAITLVGALARLYHIDVPLFDWHVYRQFDTAALARNFYEEGMNLFYPRVDWRGESPGYVEVEFQAYTYPVAILYHVFGPHEWVGRAFNILVFVASAFLLFGFVSRAFGRRAAAFAVLFYTFVPLSFYQTRAFQPDALLALGSLTGIHYFWLWTESSRWRHLLLSALGVSLAALIKPPSLYLGVPLLYLAYRRYRLTLLRQPQLWVFAALVLVPVVLWYRHAYGMWIDYGNTFGIFGRRTIAGIWPLGDEHWLMLARVLARRLFFEIATPPGLILLLVGVVASVHARARLQGGIVFWWLVGFGLYVVLVPKGHWGHDHYQLPAVFLAAAWMGYGASWLVRKGSAGRWGTAVIALALLALAARQIRPMVTVQPGRYDRIAFGERIQQLTEPDALIVFAARQPRDHPPQIYRHRTPDGEFLYCDPIDFYVSRRKGWNPDEYQATPEFMERVRGRGARYFATFFPTVLERNPDLEQWLDTESTLLEATDRWAIYRLVE